MSFKIGDLRVRRVKLVGGPCDGMQSMASHMTAIVAQNVYVWDGGADPDTFKPILDVLRQVDTFKQREERQIMAAWVKEIELGRSRALPELPQHRINLWVQLVQNGLDENLGL